MHPVTPKQIQCDLMVVGSGMAGMAASLFAARQGIDTVQVGITGEINFASGLIDLLGVHPVDQGRVRVHPWRAMAQLIDAEPRHPYARLAPDIIRNAIASFTDALSAAGQPYVFDPERNRRVITPVGTTKTTFAVPRSMAFADQALKEKPPCLIVDVAGLKGFSARQITETLKSTWPSLRAQRIGLPDFSGDLYSERLARALETEPARRQLIDAIRPHVGNARALGMPAVLGIYRTTRILADIEKALNIPVFEIPTMLPAVTGLRLREALEQHLPRLGVKAYYQQKVLSAQPLPNDGWLMTVGGQSPEHHIRARAVVLASGRFFGKGLTADRSRVHEPIFDLPVDQPPHRRQWHQKDLFDRHGHGLSRAGLDIDDHFRPADGSGKCVYANVFAAGSILAHQDWVRQKCGSGLSIATAYGAVDAYRQLWG